MSEIKHTPTPWKVHGNGTYIRSEDDKQVASLYSGPQANDIEIEKANAAHIVHCVNTFEEREALIKEMGEGLEHILEYWNRDRNDVAMHDALCHIIEISEVLLSKYKSNLG